MSLLVRELSFCSEVLLHDASSRVGAGVGDGNQSLLDAFKTPTPVLIRNIEGQTHAHLLFLYSLYPLTVRAGVHCDSNVLTCLVDLVMWGSPRIQQLCLRMLRDALPPLQPNRVNAIVAAEARRCAALFSWPAGVDAKSEAPAVLPSTLFVLLLQKITASLCVTPHTADTCAGAMCQPVGVGAGAGVLATASEATSLMRYLLQSSEASWQSAAEDAVARAVLGAGVFLAGDGLTGDVSKSERCRAALSTAAAAFCVLGADTEVLRSGARFAQANSDQAARAASTATIAASASSSGGGGGDSARSDSGAGAEAESAAAREAAQAIISKALMKVLQPVSAEGVVVSYRYGSNDASVVFDSEIDGRPVTVTQMVPIDSIVPVCEIPPRPSSVAISPDFLRVLLDLCELNIGIGADTMDRMLHKNKPGDGKSSDGAVEAFSVWRSQLKSRAMQALQILLQDASWSSAALRADMFPRLMRAALVPVALPQFIGLRWLQQRGHILRERLLDAATGVVIGQEQAADGGAQKLSPEEQRRHDMADMLMAMELGGKEICVLALQLNRDDMERAVEWLMGPQAQAFIEGGALEKGVGGSNPRWGAARDLGLVVGKPPKLCYHALEMFADDRNQATTWLMDHGAMYSGYESAAATPKDGSSAARAAAKL